MSFLQDDTDALNEVEPILVQRSNRIIQASKSAIPLLLVMKTASNQFENLMTSFDMTMPNCSDNCSDSSAATGNGGAKVSYMIVTLSLAFVSFILPTLGGLLSDARFGSLNMLWINACLELLGCSVLTVLSHFSIVHQATPVSMSNATRLHIFMSFGDTILLYMPMLYASDSSSRILIMSLYFIASGLGEIFGNLPCVLRDVFGGNYEFIGVIFSACGLICVFLLSCSRSEKPGAKSASYFHLPNSSRIRKFYRIAGGAIPFFAAVLLLRLLYRKQLDYLLDLQSDSNLLASYIGLIGWQSGSILLCIISAIAAYKRRIPDWVTLKLRIRVGLWLMLIAKLPLFIITIVINNKRAKAMGSSVAWIACFFSALSDGLFGAMSAVAIYELVSCVSNRLCKATFIGIFYTTWGFAGLLKLALVSVLRLQVVNLMEKEILWGSVICLLLVSIVYLETVSWPLVSGPLVDHEIYISEHFPRLPEPNRSER